MKITIERLVNIWISETFEVEDLSEESLDKCLEYRQDVLDSDVYWDSQEDLGPIEIYDEQRNLIREYQ